jgi:hypothetical protein
MCGVGVLENLRLVSSWFAIPDALDWERAVTTVVLVVVFTVWLLIPIEGICMMLFVRRGYRVGIPIFRETRQLPEIADSVASAPGRFVTRHWAFRRISTNTSLCRRRLDLFEYNTLPMKSVVSWDKDCVTVEVRIALSICLFLSIVFVGAIGSGIWNASRSVLATFAGTVLSTWLFRFGIVREKGRAKTILTEFEHWAKQRSPTI